MNVIRTITVGCADVGLVGRFWEVVLGWPLEIEPDGSDAFLTNPSGGPNMLFQRVPESKRTHTRINQGAMT